MKRASVILACSLVACAWAGCASAQVISRPTAFALTRIQKIIEDERYTDAIVELENLARKTSADPYDFARVSHYLAHASALADDSQRARSALEDALRRSAELPPEFLTELNLFYAQILLGDEEFEKALPLLEDWLAVETQPAAAQVFMVGYTNYRTGHLERAETLIARAIGETESPRESWLQLRYRVLMELERLDEAERLLQSMISRSSSDLSYWRMLAGHYMGQESDHQALASLMLAYRLQLLAERKDLERLVSLHSYINAPETAARLMEQWMAQETLPTDAKTLRQLGELWLVARERGAAKKALLRAAELAPDGKLYELIGGIHFEDEDWLEAHTAYKMALKIGGIDSPGRIYLLSGMSAARAGMKDAARAALEQAAQTSELKSQARAMLRKLANAGP